MPAIPPKVELCGIKQQADDLIEAAFKRGVPQEDEL